MRSTRAVAVIVELRQVRLMVLVVLMLAAAADWQASDGSIQRLIKAAWWIAAAIAVVEVHLLELTNIHVISEHHTQWPATVHLIRVHELRVKMSGCVGTRRPLALHVRLLHDHFVLVAQ